MLIAREKEKGLLTDAANAEYSQFGGVKRTVPLTGLVHPANKSMHWYL